MSNKKLYKIKSSGFKTPNDYFESFDEKFFSKLNTKNKLDATIKTGFKVPDNYFESLNDKVLNNTIVNNKSKVIQLFSKRNLIYISSIAAAIVLLFNLSVFKNQPSFSNLDIETIENYIEDESINSYEIATLFIDENIEEDNFIERNFNEANIEEYLLNNTDIEVLMIE